MGYSMQDFMNKVAATYFSGDYSGVTHAGLAVMRRDESPSVFLAQRAYDETDDPEVQETWEVPGGSLDPGEEPFAGAEREFGEEIGFPLPDGSVINGWRSNDGVYQGFVYEPNDFPDTSDWQPTDEVQAIGWFTHDEAMQLNLRPEMRDFDWALLDVSGNKEGMMDDVNEMDEMDEMDEEQEPELSLLDLTTGPIPVHGVLAPEDTESGDSRGFNAGAVTRRPYRLPFMWQEKQTSGHDDSVVVGSVDRLMRKDGLIHWEGALMPTADAGKFAELLAFFGRFGVSVDGDKGNLDSEKTSSTGVVWFDAVRAAGLTAVSIPAFSEAYVAFGPHPEMSEMDDEQFDVLTASGDAVQFKRGPGWVTNPKETKRLHDYWTKKGRPGYAKIRWGTPGDFTRAKKLIGEKIGANSPEDLKYLNQIIAQWHHDALGYWPGEANKPGNPTTEEIRRRYKHGLEAVITAAGTENKPSLSYFHRPEGEFDALTILDPDEHGFRRTFGYAAQWGVCHVGMGGRCTEPPRTYTDDYPQFHLGKTATEEGHIYTGVLTYGIGHRDAEQILSESAEQAYFDNIDHAWAAVRVGEDDKGIWFSGVVLPGIPDDHLTKISASGQVSGEWLRGAMRACLTVNVPGFPVERPSAVYDDDGNVMALAASAFGGVDDAPCEPTPRERMEALAMADAEARWENMKKGWN